MSPPSARLVALRQFVRSLGTDKPTFDLEARRTSRRHVKRMADQGCTLRTGARARPAHRARVFAKHHPHESKRAQGMPGEGLTHGPRAIRKHGEGTTGSAESSGIPCAMV